MPYRGLLEVYSVHWRHSQQPPAHWAVCPLTDQTFVGVSLASVHAPGLSCGHVTRSAHRASGYQLAIHGAVEALTFLEPSQLQRLSMQQDNNQTTKTATCAPRVPHSERPQTWEWTNLLRMQNFAGEMHHH